MFLRRSRTEILSALGVVALVSLVMAVSLVMLEDRLAKLSAVLLTAVSVALMHQGSRVLDPRRLSIPGFFYIFYIPMIYLPSFAVFAQRTGDSRYSFLFGAASVMLTVPLGVLTANAVCRYSNSENERFFSGPIRPVPPPAAMYWVCVIMAVAAVMLSLLYFFQVGLHSLPLVYMFEHPGAVEELTLMREQSFKMLDPRWNTGVSSVIFYAYLFLRTLGFPFLITLAFGYYLCTKQKRWFALFLGALFFGLLYAAASIARAPVAAIMLRLAFFYYLYRGGRLGKGRTAVLAALILAFPLLVTGLAYGSKGLGDALSRVAGRLFYTPADDLYYYFEIFPDHMAYQYGGTLLKPIMHLMGLPHFYIENFVYLYQFPLGIATGHANAAFISNLHADFGLPGVLIGSYLIGIMMQVIQISIARAEKTVLSVAIYCFMLYAFWVLNFGSITSVLGTNGVVFVLVAAWLTRVSALLVQRFQRFQRGAKTVLVGTHGRGVI